MLSVFEVYCSVVQDRVNRAREELPEKWQRAVRRAVVESRRKSLPLYEAAPDLKVRPVPGGYDLKRLEADPKYHDLKYRLLARAAALSLRGHFEAADAELPPEQVTELERLVAEGLPDD